MAENELAILNLDQITDPKFLLRYVNHSLSAYTELLDSIRQHGVIQSVLVRPHPDGTPDKFELVDGMYRITCAREAGRATVPATIREMTDEEVLAWQIRTNALRPETTKIEFARQIRRIQEYRPGVTLAELALLVNKTPVWVKSQLDLLELDERTQRMVDDGELPLSSAYMLSKVPKIHRTPELIAQACVMRASDFKIKAAGIIKGFMEDVRAGRLSHNYNNAPFKPIAHQRSIKKVQAEIDNPHFGPQIIVAEKLKKPLDIWKAALRFTIHLDQESIEEQRKLAENKPDRDLMQLYEREPDELDPA